MEKITRFEDLIAWQKARTLTKEVYVLTKTDPFSRDYGLTRQMQRAAVSIMSNIAEGFERSRPGEFHQYLSIAKGSCGELRSQLYIALDIGYIEQELFQQLFTLCEEVGRIIGGLRASVQRQK